MVLSQDSLVSRLQFPFIQVFIADCYSLCCVLMFVYADSSALRFLLRCFLFRHATAVSTGAFHHMTCISSRRTCLPILHRSCRRPPPKTRPMGTPPSSRMDTSRHRMAITHRQWPLLLPQHRMATIVN